MFEFKDVTKNYISKRGKDCVALDSVNLKLPDKGMVFIAGRSGSGKSTLLNILGGLDKPTSGEVSFNGNKFSAFNDADFAAYRNNVVGFIFQEFNLLTNINVEQNIMIPLSLQNQKDKTEKIEAALAKVGLSGYEKQQINEMSGGQKQRTAIARAIVKNPQVILADEPTGNLDSKTATDIFDLLKELSKQCLVVVVTHDKENAKKYHDYLIELSDGEIIFNNCEETLEKISPLEKFKATLPLRISLKMGAANLLKRPIKTVSVILIGIISVFCIVMSQTFILFSYADVQSRIITENDIDVFSLERLAKNEDGGKVPANFDYKSTDYISKNYPNLSKTTNYESSYGFLINDSTDITKLGLTFVGEKTELDENSVYLTKAYLDSLYSRKEYSVLNDKGKYVMLLESRFPKTTMVGKKIMHEIWDEATYFTIAGIVSIGDLLLSKSKDENDYVYRRYGNKMFFNKDYVNEKSYAMELGGKDKVFTFNCENYNFATAASEEHPIYYTLYSEGNYSKAKEEGLVIMRDGSLVKYSDIKLNNTEIILSAQLYNKIFNKTWSYYDYLDISETNEITLKLMPSKIGKELNFKYEEKEYETAIHDEKYTIAGVFFDFKNRIESFILQEDVYNEIYNNREPRTIFVNKNSIKDLASFLKDMESKDIFVENAYSNTLKNVEEGFKDEKYIFIMFSVILVFLMVIMTVNLISMGIVARTKELGILKALGAKNTNLFALFFSEAFFLSTITFIASLGLALFGLAFFNKQFLSGQSLTLTLFTFNIFTLLTIIITAVGAFFLATLIPLLKIKKMNPVAAIKTE